MSVPSPPQSAPVTDDEDSQPPPPQPLNSPQMPSQPPPMYMVPVPSAQEVTHFVNRPPLGFRGMARPPMPMMPPGWVQAPPWVMRMPARPRMPRIPMMFNPMSPMNHMNRMRPPVRGAMRPPPKPSATKGAKGKKRKKTKTKRKPATALVATSTVPATSTAVEVAEADKRPGRFSNSKLYRNLQIGTKVQLQKEAKICLRRPELVEAYGVIETMPEYPTTWVGIKLDHSGELVKVRSTNFVLTDQPDGTCKQVYTDRLKKSLIFNFLRQGSEVIVRQHRSIKAPIRAIILKTPVYPSTWVTVRSLETQEVIKTRTSQLELPEELETDLLNPKTYENPSKESDPKPQAEDAGDGKDEKVERQSDQPEGEKQPEPDAQQQQEPQQEEQQQERQHPAGVDSSGHVSKTYAIATKRARLTLGIEVKTIPKPPRMHRKRRAKSPRDDLAWDGRSRPEEVVMDDKTVTQGRPRREKRRKTMNNYVVLPDSDEELPPPSEPYSGDSDAYQPDFREEFDEDFAMDEDMTGAARHMAAPHDRLRQEADTPSPTPLYPTLAQNQGIVIRQTASSRPPVLLPPKKRMHVKPPVPVRPGFARRRPPTVNARPAPKPTPAAQEPSIHQASPPEIDTPVPAPAPCSPRILPQTAQPILSAAPMQVDSESEPLDIASNVVPGSNEELPKYRPQTPTLNQTLEEENENPPQPLSLLQQEKQTQPQPSSHEHQEQAAETEKGAMMDTVVISRT